MTHMYEDDDGDRRECGGEDGLCQEHFEEEDSYWRSYFGIVGLPGQAVINRLNSWAPFVLSASAYADYTEED